MDRRFQAISRLEFFAGLPEQDRAQLASVSVLRSLERGRVISRIGVGDECLFLISGRAGIRVPRGPASAELPLAALDAGEILSEPGWGSDHGGTNYEAVAFSACEVLFLPRAPLEHVLVNHPRVAILILKAMAVRVERLVDLAFQSASFDVGDRLYCKFAELSKICGRARDGGILIEHGLCQKELADCIGASRESVNRQLALWREQGLITPQRRVLLVNDPAGLRRAVSPAARSVDLSVPASE